MKGHKDPTKEQALGAVQNEWKQMARIAVIIREGRCAPIWAEEQSKKFTGIFKRLMEDPIDQVKKEC